MEASWLERFFNEVPAWAKQLDPVAPHTVAVFLNQLKGNTPILTLAQHTGLNRFSISRWVSGRVEPKLPAFIQLVDATSGRLLDFVAAFVEPSTLPSLSAAWERLQLARRAAYDMPWSHGVLRALELKGAPRGLAAQRAWIARQLGLSTEQVADALVMLEKTLQVKKTNGGYRLRQMGSVVDTGDDKATLLSRSLECTWRRPQ